MNGSRFSIHSIRLFIPRSQIRKDFIIYEHHSPERYDNKRVIVQTHIKAIMDLPTITKENAISSLTGNELPSLKQLLDFIVQLYQVLEASTRASTSVKKVEAKSQPNVKRLPCAATVKPK
ncbi:hypothetical protein ALC53_12572 [Atta colombica]|uniref:Uncharacterized protein n=1 Tax=Atta colombica TaxID=520822 RepID=A0A195AXV7_9HYME|nr:hypothetical protein ALC53_12572 [Atta colombica]